MGRGVLCLPLLLLTAQAADDPRVKDALYRLAREASQFWQAAPGFAARETIRQRIIVAPKRRKTAPDAPPPQPKWKAQQIESWYGFGAFRRAPEALREFRRSYAIDDKPIEAEARARAGFAAELTSRDEEERDKLLEEFQKNIMPGAATDFGQVILLFTKGKLEQYAYEPATQARMGADRALVIPFKQSGGGQALRIVEGRRQIERKLEGALWVREGDYLPLRIAFNSERALDKKTRVRDEATVDYLVTAGALLPASLVYRRFENDVLVVEANYQYQDWQPLKPNAKQP